MCHDRLPKNRRHPHMPTFLRREATDIVRHSLENGHYCNTSAHICSRLLHKSITRRVGDSMKSNRTCSPTDHSLSYYCLFRHLIEAATSPHLGTNRSKAISSFAVVHQAIAIRGRSLRDAAEACRIVLRTRAAVSRPRWIKTHRPRAVSARVTIVRDQRAGRAA